MLREGVGTLREGVGTLREGVRTLREGVGTLREGVRTLARGGDEGRAARCAVCGASSARLVCSPWTIRFSGLMSRWTTESASCITTSAESSCAVRWRTIAIGIAPCLSTTSKSSEPLTRSSTR
eukprot:4847419-Prymnesium_polylepis.2